MAIREDAVDDLETWLEGLGKLRTALLEAGLKTKEELLWLSQPEIEFCILTETFFCPFFVCDESICS